MLVLLPVVLLVSILLLNLVFYRSKQSFGLAWLISIGVSIVVWGTVLVQRFVKPAPFSLAEWYLGEGASMGLVFQLDQSSWGYAFGLASLLLAVILTAAAGLKIPENPWPWTGALMVTAASLVAVLAKTPLALITAWSIIDILEVVVVLRTVTSARQKQQVIVSFGARLAGILAVVWAVLASRARGQGLTLDSFPTEVGIFLLLAAGLRLGVIPLHLPFTEEFRLQRGLGTTVQLASSASSLVLLSRLPPTVVPPDWAPYFLIFTSLAAVYGALRWLTAGDVLDGRPYWLIAIAGLAMGSAIRGHPEASLAWGTAMLFAGGSVFLFSARNWALRILIFLSAIGLTGLPFTPAASGWRGLVVLPFNLLDIVIILAHAILVMGFVRHLLAERASTEEMEGWAKTTYTLGLMILGASYWVTGVFGWEGSLTVGNWWASAVSSVLCVGGVIGFTAIKRTAHRQPELAGNWFALLAGRVANILARFITLGWFYRLAALVFSLLQRLVNFISLLLEGEGGIIWAFVLLTLILSLLLPGGGG